VARARGHFGGRWRASWCWRKIGRRGCSACVSAGAMPSSSSRSAGVGVSTACRWISRAASGRSARSSPVRCRCDRCVFGVVLVVRRGNGGALVWADPERPQSVYLAAPGSAYQVEVYDPLPRRALSVALSAELQPVPAG
jgi:hypothetical protein